MLPSGGGICPLPLPFFRRAESIRALGMGKGASLVKHKDIGTRHDVALLLTCLASRRSASQTVRRPRTSDSSALMSARFQARIYNS
ncbi:hypothetical protein Zmor_004918 [Zophobas morio]|uniref:Uncharacterized protein n=1 Tax=Zophobas morio TaxID=2755281 RepID=A0AA38MJZ5_9CUCU|nr:hypothetical protein Zmor_004918 [Zophobas morio]